MSERKSACEIAQAVREHLGEFSLEGLENLRERVQECAPRTSAHAEGEALVDEEFDLDPTSAAKKVDCDTSTLSKRQIGKSMPPWFRRDGESEKDARQRLRSFFVVKDGKYSSRRLDSFNEEMRRATEQEKATQERALHRLGDGNETGNAVSS